MNLNIEIIAFLLAIYRTSSYANPAGSNELYLNVGGKQFYFEIILKTNFFRAAQFCRLHGMQLASLQSQAENEAIKQQINKLGYSRENFWTSGTDLGQEGKFFWLSNGQPIIYKDFFPNEPNNVVRHHIGENCVELLNINGQMRWNDNQCSENKYFICDGAA